MLSRGMKIPSTFTILPLLSSIASPTFQSFHSDGPFKLQQRLNTYHRRRKQFESGSSCAPSSILHFLGDLRVRFEVEIFLLATNLIFTIFHYHPTALFPVNRSTAHFGSYRLQDSLLLFANP
ncbi:hypothetical protein K438DRAFT_172058 [Mycena galopus ATCC 62051]|nr:hypothetical protein K438DRAFT_172058 [Mycena galopus ATCC 62051]